MKVEATAAAIKVDETGTRTAAKGVTEVGVMTEGVTAAKGMTEIDVMIKVDETVTVAPRHHRSHLHRQTSTWY